jgi:hypothetical protein
MERAFPDATQSLVPSGEKADLLCDTALIGNAVVSVAKFAQTPAVFLAIVRSCPLLDGQ